MSRRKPRHRKTTGLATTGGPSVAETDEFAKAMFNVQRYGDPALFGLVREPFLQAWQKNLENCDHRSPHLLAFSAVYACVTIIASDIAKLPLRVMRLKNGKGPSVEVNYRHPINLLYRNPNRYQTMLEFMQFHMANKLMFGNAYAIILRDERGVPSSIHNVSAQRVRPMIESETRRILYQVTSQSQNNMEPVEEAATRGEEGTLYIPEENMIHDRMNTLWNNLLGISPIYAAAASSSSGARILMNSEAFFGNMSRPSGILTSDTTIQQPTADRLKEEWRKRYTGGQMGETAVLGDGLKWQAITMEAADSQLIEQLKFSIEDVARVFRVPLYKLADLKNTTYRNSEQMARDYYQGCLQYHIEATEQRFNKSLGLDGLLQYSNFDLDALFKMESDMRFETYDKAIKSGVMSINEARAKESMDPVKGGEEPRLQMQYVPLSHADKLLEQQTNPAPAPAPAPAPEPEDDDEEDKSLSGKIKIFGIGQSIKLGELLTLEEIRRNEALAA